MLDWIRARLRSSGSRREALLRDARAAQERGDAETARVRALELLRGSPRDVGALCLLAGMCADARRIDEGLQWAQRAVAADPQAAAARYAEGRVWEAAGRHADAESAYRRAVALDPRHARAHNNLGVVLHLQGRLDEALTCYRRAIEIEPSQPEANQNYAAIVRDTAAREAAIRGYVAQTQANPSDAAAFNHLANLYVQLGRYEDARRSFDRALLLDPERAEAHFARAQLLLLLGEYAEGWKEYEWRWRIGAFDAPARRFREPMWNGERIPGATLLIHGETGLGDMLQFVRYARLAAERSGARVVLECPAPLEPLLRGVDGVAEIVEQGTALPRFDAHVPLIRLPAVFATTLDTVPWNGPYVRADPARARRWGEFFPADGRLRVGLVWAGNPGHWGDRDRTIPADALAPLAAVQGAAFYSLQKTAPGAQAPARPAGLELIDLGSRFADFSDTAAAASHLDVVLSADTSMAHLAGAMGRPVWVMLAYFAEWRYLLGRDDSPWYPTMRLFRQATPGDWPGVAARVAHELRRRPVRER